MLNGIASDPLWRRCYERLVWQYEEQGVEPGGSEPEFRLPATIAGVFVVPVALFGELVRPLTTNASNCDACRVWVDHVYPCKCIGI
jgi:hypothetical protein